MFFINSQLIVKNCFSRPFEPLIRRADPPSIDIKAIFSYIWLFEEQLHEILLTSVFLYHQEAFFNMTSIL